MGITEFEKLPPWLMSLVDQRMALVEELAAATADQMGADIIWVTLTDPAPGQTFEQWDRGCDNPGCSTEWSPGMEYHTIHLKRTTRGGRKVLITGGVCGRCKPT